MWERCKPPTGSGCNKLPSRTLRPESNCQKIWRSLDSTYRGLEKSIFPKSKFSPVLPDYLVWNPTELIIQVQVPQLVCLIRWLIRCLIFPMFDPSIFISRSTATICYKLRQPSHHWWITADPATFAEAVNCYLPQYCQSVRRAYLLCTLICNELQRYKGIEAYGTSVWGVIGCAVSHSTVDLVTDVLREAKDLSFISQSCLIGFSLFKQWVNQHGSDTGGSDQGKP